jgi:hypothetical protein
MSVTVCIVANTYGYTDGGGHVWEYLNWALGCRATGAEVLWLERVPEGSPPETVRANAGALRSALEPYGFGDRVVLVSDGGEPLPPAALDGCASADDAAGADLLLNFGYGAPPTVPDIGRTALVDIDPGLLQIWASRGWVEIGGYDVYFTTGETVGTPRARFPDLGLVWQYTPSCVALDWWRPRPAADDAPLTTISNWSTYDEWLDDGDEWYSNDKKAGFEPFLELPRRSPRPLELALSLAPDEDDERAVLAGHGWRVRSAETVASKPWEYQEYIASSGGEFSCAKPSCMRLANAWVSNRTLCYLASARPAVVQDTGPSELLPDEGGLFRFTNVDEAAAALETVDADYERQSMLARRLAEERFDAARVCSRLLERAVA